MGRGKILSANDYMTMTHNILITRLQGKKSYLLRVGSLRTRTVDAMGRQRREG